MGHFAYLTPVGPFAGLSNDARHKIGELFPTLSLIDIEEAAGVFLIELQRSTVQSRLTEAREELNVFAKELARFDAALNRIRQHRLDHAVGEASRMICGQDKFEEMEAFLSHLRKAIRQTSRVLPSVHSELASRRLVANLARHIETAGACSSAVAAEWLLNLVELIFEDTMVGGDAATAVTGWRRAASAEIDHERTNVLLDLVP